jgi:hypothetical protein
MIKLFLTSVLLSSIPILALSQNYTVTKAQESEFSAFLELEVGEKLKLLAVEDQQYEILKVQTEDGRIGTISKEYVSEVGTPPTTSADLSIEGEPVYVCNRAADNTDVTVNASYFSRSKASLANNEEVFIVGDVDVSDGSRFFEINYWEPSKQQVSSGFIPYQAVRRECNIQGLVADLKGIFEVGNDSCYFVVGSRRTEYEAGKFVDTLTSFKPADFEVYQSENGWMEITLGAMPASDFEKYRTQWNVPSDSLCSKGVSYTQKIQSFCDLTPLTCTNNTTVKFAGCEIASASASLSYLSWSSKSGEFMDTRDAFCSVGHDLTIQSYDGFRKLEKQYVFSAVTPNERVVIDISHETRKIQMRWPDRRSTERTAQIIIEQVDGLLGALLRGGANTLRNAGSVKISREYAEKNALEFCTSYWTKDTIFSKASYTYCVIDYCSEYNGSWNCQADHKR